MYAPRSGLAELYGNSAYLLDKTVYKQGFVFKSSDFFKGTVFIRCKSKREIGNTSTTAPEVASLGPLKDSDMPKSLYHSSFSLILNTQNHASMCGSSGLSSASGEL